MSLELPCSKNGAEYNHYISCATSQQIWKDRSPRGWRSLMGCTVLFLPEEVEVTIVMERELQCCFNYTGPSINHAPCGWQLNPSQTHKGSPRPSQSTGWAQQPWSQHTHCTWTQFQSPAATNRAKEAGKSQRRQQIAPQQKGKKQKHFRTEQKQRQMRERFSSVCMCVCVRALSWTKLN